MSLITLHIEEATDVIATDRGGTSDPFIQVSLLDFTGRAINSEKYKTQVIRKTLNPAWHETCTLGAHYAINPANPPTIQLKMFDKDVLGEDPMGKVDIPVDSLTEGTTVDEWYTLEKFGRMRTVSGRLHLRIELSAGGAGDATAGGDGAGEGKGAEIPVSMPPEDDQDFEDKEPNVLHIIIVQAKGLQIMDRNMFGGGGSSDPLVKIRVGDERNTTSVKKKTLTPIWNERFQIPCFESSDSIELTIEDHDLTTNDLMGKIMIPLHQFEDRHVERKWYRIGNKQGVVDETDRGEIEVVIKWGYDPNVQKKAKGLLGKLGSAVGMDDDSTEPDADDDQDMDEEDPNEGKTEEEIAKEKEEAEEAEKALKEELNSIEVKSGDYQIQVHIIEARDLKAEDVTGLSDPVVYIECFGEKQNTEVKEECLSAVWDEVFIFNKRNLDKEEFEMGVIRVAVMDADTFSKNDLIGAYAFDATYVYFQQDHELYRKWVALMDDDDPEDTGVQGYLKLSVMIMGPGDKMKVHNEEEEIAKERMAEKGGDMSSMVMMPPSIKKETVWLVTTCFRAEQLPQMDTAAIGRGGIDAFFQTTFAGGKPCKSKVKTVKGERAQLNPKWNYELWYPVTVPTMTNQIKNEIFDHDTVGSNELVATFYSRFDVLQKIPGKNRGPFWVNLYGAPTKLNPNPLRSMSRVVPGLGIDFKTQYNTFPEMASTWRGRVMVSERIETERPEKYAEDEVKPFRCKIRKLTARQEPPKKPYILQALLVSGTELPPPRLGNKLQIKISCGQYELFSNRVECKKGVCEWNQMLTTEEMHLPVDIDTVPDIFIYLCKGSGNDLTQFCFRRFKAKKLMEKGFNVTADWINLAEDKAIDALEDGKFPGSVLMRLGFGTKEMADEASDEWSAAQARMNQRQPFQLRMHLYQGRNLPAADSNGLLDPYLVINFLGEEIKIEKQKKTTDPLWYQSFTFDTALPDREFFPQVNVQLYDWDQFDSDDFLGQFFFNVKDAFELADRANDPLPDPEWHDVFFEIPGDTEGSILASFQLLRKNNPGEVMPELPDIKPEYRQAYLEIIALGIRDMQPYNFMAMQLPYVEFELDLADGKQNHTTNTSKRPDASNPNFLERIIMPVSLPTNALFCTPLKMRARDTRLGGYSTPVVGNGVIDLVKKIPWSKTYEPPQQEMLKKVEKAAGAPLLEGSGGDVEEGELETKENEEGDESAPLLGEPVDPEAAKAAAEAAQQQAVNAQIDSKVAAAMRDRKKKVADPEVAVPAPEPTVKELLEQKLTAEDTGAGVFGALKHVDLPDDRKAKHRRKKKTADDFFMDTAELMAEEEDEGPPKYMKNRRTLESELEEEFKTCPFETYELSLGNKFGVFGGNWRIMGRFKGLIRVMEKEDDPPLFDLGQLLKPQGYKVRLYVLRGIGLTPMDAGIGGRPGKSDPYLKVKLGKELFDDRQNKIDDVTEVDFYKLVEMNTELPGAGRMTINVMDHDDIGSDDLIGKTVIDLEDRWFDSRWQEWGQENMDNEDLTNVRWATKPLERRNLYVPTNTRPQGVLECWVDIMTPAEATAFPPDDVSLPPTAMFEVRIVIWKTKDVVAMDTLENMNDLFVRVWIENTDPQDTDTHWRCKKGKGSFNWRMLFEVELGHNTRSMKFPYLHFQMWDKDILKWNDCIAEGMVDLGMYFRKAYRKNTAIKLFENTEKGAAKKRKEREKKQAEYEPEFDPDIPLEEHDENAPLLGDPNGDAPAESKGDEERGGAGAQNGDGSNRNASVGEPPSGDGVQMTDINGEQGKAESKTEEGAESGAKDEEKKKKKSEKKGADAGEEKSGGVFGWFRKKDDKEGGGGEGSEGDAEKGEGDAKAGAAAGGDDDNEELREFVNNIKEMTGLWDIDPPDSSWLYMDRTNHETGEREPMGRLAYSVQIWPKDKALAMPAGAARNDPNSDPYLPPPTGRMKFSLNPFVMGAELCGPALCFKIVCCCVCLAMMALLLFCQPVMNILLYTFSQ